LDPRREEVTGDWRRLHNEELHNLYTLPTVRKAIESRRLRWTWHVARMDDMRNTYKILAEKTERKKTIWGAQPWVGIL
jgi:hypothetical protein